jgi:hypothetical protein
MRLPGDAVLEFRLTSMGYEETEILQISKFLPRGVLGLLYWYGLYPFHQFIFKGMLNAIAGKAERPIVKKPEKFIRSQNACRI